MFISVLLVAGSLLFGPIPIATAHAASNVSNTISVVSNTGGNHIEAGVIHEGTGYSSVDIITMVDGETIVDIHETSTGTPVVIEDVTTTSTNNTVVTTDIRLNAHDEIQEYVSITSVDAELTTTSSAPITQLIDEKIEDAPEQEHSLMARIVDSITRTVAYVVSKLFS